MPKAAVAAGAAVDVLPLTSIAGRLVEAFSPKGLRQRMRR
jgi:hypothetical protein